MAEKTKTTQPKQKGNAQKSEVKGNIPKEEEKQSAYQNVKMKKLYIGKRGYFPEGYIALLPRDAAENFIKNGIAERY